MALNRVVAPAEVSVERFAHEWVEAGIVAQSFVPVADWWGRLVGLASLDRMAQVPPEKRANVPIGSLAVPLSRVVVCRPDEDLAEVAALLRGTPGLPAVVLDRGTVVGLIFESDLDRGRDLARLAD